MTHIQSRAKALLMLDELHRLGFEQLRFANLGGFRTHIYAARDEAQASQTDPRFIPAPRRFTTPMFHYEPAGSAELAHKWDELFRGELRPNHLAGMFVLDFPDIARNGFGADITYRDWFRGLRPRLQQGHFPETHPRYAFHQPHRELQWHGGVDAELAPYPGPPPNPYHLSPSSPEPTLPQHEEPTQITLRALLMLNELHRFGFEQLRCHSYGGHGYAHIFAARDEAPITLIDRRFLPAVRRFSTLGTIDRPPGQDQSLVEKWASLLAGCLKPNHLAGMFLLDFPDIARYGFGPDETFRHWFRGLQPYLHRGLLPVTHDGFSHAEPLRTLKWQGGSAAVSGVPYPGQPENHHTTQDGVLADLL